MPTLLALVVGVFLSACSFIAPNDYKLRTYESSLPNLASNMPSRLFDESSYLDNYFSPWDKDFSTTKEDALWPWKIYAPALKYYDETLKPRTSEWFIKQLENANLGNLGNLNQNAILITDANIRAIPTNLPIFKNPKDAGEGFPFDYNQNSSIKPFTPIKLSHYSKDLMWAFIQTDSFFGWVETNTFIVLPKTLEEKIRQSPKAVVLKPIFLWHENGFYAKATLGTLLPLLESNDVLGILPSLEVVPLEVDINSIALWPISMEKKSVLMVLQELLDEPYGWGGMFGHRDCSAFTKDFFTPFGIWLPRNSKAQYHNGVFVNLETLSNKDKTIMIKRFATPFLSLIYMPGHIMLYVGIKDETPLVAHNAWGIKTSKFGEKGRYIIGKAIVSDISMGDDYPWVDPSTLPINQIIGFSNQGPISPKESLLLAYPEAIKEIRENKVIFYNGTTLPFSSNMPQTQQTLLENPDIQAQFLFSYPKLSPLVAPSQDPGRFRNEDFFKALYGKNEMEVKNSLVPIRWLPSHTNQTLLFHKSNGAAKALERVSKELDALPLELLSFVNNPAGTYNYRTIADTNRLSAHSFGIAIDINTDRGDYWRWSKTGEYKNQIPKAIVDIFEKNGFIWGGRWEHFDTFHFEFRPELTLP